ncbi:MAG: hypothetical protein Q4A83_08385 [Bacillota bacterium]|nr:hypothetical protein [Bacillota bacterium]
MKNSKGLLVFIGIRTVGLILLGLAFIVLGVYVLINPAEYDYEATATISRIEATGGEWVTDADGHETYEDTYTVYVSYDFEGREIKDAELNSYSSSMKVGDSVDIEFNADDTAHVSEVGFSILPIVAIVAGTVAVVVGVVEIIKLPETRARF